MEGAGHKPLLRSACIMLKRRTIINMLLLHYYKLYVCLLTCQLTYYHYRTTSIPCSDQHRFSCLVYCSTECGHLYCRVLHRQSFFDSDRQGLREATSRICFLEVVGDAVSACAASINLIRVSSAVM